MTTSVKVKKKKSAVPGKRMPLILQIICKREVKRIVLDYRLAPDEWLAEKETVVIPPGMNKRRADYLLEVQEELESKKRELEKTIVFLEERGELSAAKIIDHYNTSYRPVYWLDYMQQMMEEKKTNRAEATFRNYQSTFRIFRQFLGSMNLSAKEFDKEVVKQFEHYLFSRSLTTNTISFYCRILRMVWNRAVADGIVESQPSPFRQVCMRVEKTRKRAINESTIRRLEGLTLESRGLAFARDMFLFCYYARGMTFVDLAHLTEKNIEGNTLIYVRKKTGQVLKVGLLPVMKQLIRKYRGRGPFLFPILKNSHPSFQEYDSALRLQNKRLGKLGKLIGCYLSTYVARHTWASVAKMKGISEDVISESMGHTSVKTTRIYIASLDPSRLDKANRIVIFGKAHSRSVFDGHLP